MFLVWVSILACAFIGIEPSEAQPAGLWPLGLLKYIFCFIPQLTLHAGFNSFGLLIFWKIGDCFQLSTWLNRLSRKLQRELGLLWSQEILVGGGKRYKRENNGERFAPASEKARGSLHFHPQPYPWTGWWHCVLLPIVSGLSPGWPCPASKAGTFYLQFLYGIKLLFVKLAIFFLDPSNFSFFLISILTLQSPNLFRENLWI